MWTCQCIALNSVGINVDDKSCTQQNHLRSAGMLLLFFFFSRCCKQLAQEEEQKVLAKKKQNREVGVFSLTIFVVVERSLRLVAPGQESLLFDLSWDKKQEWEKRDFTMMTCKGMTWDGNGWPSWGVFSCILLDEWKKSLVVVTCCLFWQKMWKMQA